MEEGERLAAGMPPPISMSCPGWTGRGAGHRVKRSRWRSAGRPGRAARCCNSAALHSTLYYLRRVPEPRQPGRSLILISATAAPRGLGWSELGGDLGYVR